MEERTTFLKQTLSSVLTLSHDQPFFNLI